MQARYAKPGDKVSSYLLDDDDNKIPVIFTVKYVSVSYALLKTKEYKKLERKIDSLMENYTEEKKNIILELMEQKKQIKPETSYIRSDELDSKYSKKDLENCYTFIVTEEEYDKYNDGTCFKPYCLEINTCKIIK